jgi:hypothetical protein
MALAGLTIIVFGAVLWQGERPSRPKGNPDAQAAPEGSAVNSGVVSNNGAVLSQRERKSANSKGENPSVPSSSHGQAAGELFARRRLLKISRAAFEASAIGSEPHHPLTKSTKFPRDPT